MSPEKIPPEQIHNLKQRLDLREIAARYTLLRGGREQYGPCPRCGGADRFHCQQDMFFCRQCWPPEAGKGRHDVFTFVEFLGLAHGFREAYIVVCDWAHTLPPVRPPVTSTTNVPVEPAIWQMRIQQEVTHCCRRLTSDGGHQGRAYLAGRGIVRQTWQAAQLGLVQRFDAAGYKGWAIALPWFYDGQITAIQYRFLEAQGQRYTRFCYARYYGETILYTLPPNLLTP